MSGGRDVGVVINRPNRDGPCLLPACGGVGTQYTPATGWAQALVYRGRVLKDPAVAGSIAVAHGGEASHRDQRFLGVAQHRDDRAAAAPLFHRGQRLRHLGAGHEADAGRRHRGEPRGLPATCRSFPATAPNRSPRPALIDDGGRAPCARGDGPVLLQPARAAAFRVTRHRTRRPTRAPEEIDAERARDPLLQLRQRLVPAEISEAAWQALEAEAESTVAAALARIESRPPISAATVARYVFTERRADGSPDLQAQGGQWADGVTPPAGERRRDRTARASTC